MFHSDDVQGSVIGIPNGIQLLFEHLKIHF